MSCTTEKGDCIHAHWLVTSTDQVYLRSDILGKRTEIDRCPHVILKSVHAKPCILPAFFVLNWWLNTYQKLNINQESPPHLKSSWNGMEMKKSTHTCPVVQITCSRHSYSSRLGTSLPVQEMDAKYPKMMQRLRVYVLLTTLLRGVWLCTAAHLTTAMRKKLHTSGMRDWV